MTQLQQDTSPSSQESPIFSSPFKLSRLPKTWWEQLHGTQAVSVWEARQLLLTWTRVPLGHKGWPAVSPRTAWSMPCREWSTAHCKFPIPCKNTSAFCKKQTKSPKRCCVSGWKVGIFKFPADKAVFEQTQTAGPHKLPHSRAVVALQSALIMD